MGLYYSTDMVLRWYKADDSQLKQDRGRTQYTAISNARMGLLAIMCANGLREITSLPMDIRLLMTERFQMTHWHK